VHFAEASLSSDSIAVKISFKEYAKFTGPFAPPVVPASLANKLSEVFEYPEAWWTGWFVRYALRLQPSADIEIESFLRNINFSQPIVGCDGRAVINDFSLLVIPTSDERQTKFFLLKSQAV